MKNVWVLSQLATNLEYLSLREAWLGVRRHKMIPTIHTIKHKLEGDMKGNESMQNLAENSFWFVISSVKQTAYLRMVSYHRLLTDFRNWCVEQQVTTFTTQASWSELRDNHSNIIVELWYTTPLGSFKHMGHLSGRQHYHVIRQPPPWLDRSKATWTCACFPSSDSTSLSYVHITGIDQSIMAC